MNRRGFLTNGAILGIATPLIATKAIVDLTRQQKDPLPMKQSGEILTADFLNELVTRINDLESRV
jgi:hypothetical protein